MNAKTSAISAGAATEMTTSAPANDLIALVSSTSVNCAGASAASVVVSGDQFVTPATLVAGSYKVLCCAADLLKCDHF